MILISYRGIFDGNNFQDANTVQQINKARSYGYTVMIDVWRVNNKLYLGNDQPITEVSENYIRGNKFYINARNNDMFVWLESQNIKQYPNYFRFTETYQPFVTASNGKIITPGTVPINNNSIIFLPEITDTAMFSTVKLKCFGIISSYLSFIQRMRNEGVWY